jgi:cytidine deaminase
VSVDNFEPEDFVKLIYRKLVAAAKKARCNAYCPYSKFKVGAAILASSGKIYAGANIENASYGLTLCAERAAAARAVSDGERRFTAIAIVAGDRPVVPCGACRQVLAEFGADMDVILGTLGGGGTVINLSALLPMSFTPRMLERK